MPAHPLAGAEKNGVAHARADLFDGRLTILTPVAAVCDDRAAERVEAFWRALGSRTMRVTPESHDRALAVTSHDNRVLTRAIFENVRLRRVLSQ